MSRNFKDRDIGRLLAGHPALLARWQNVLRESAVNLKSAVHWRRECKKIENTCRKAVARCEQLRLLNIEMEADLALKERNVIARALLSILDEPEKT